MPFNAIDTLSIMWKSDFFDEKKSVFFQDVAVVTLLYGLNTWTLTKRTGEKLERHYTRALAAISNKSWKQYSTKLPETMDDRDGWR